MAPLSGYFFKTIGFIMNEYVIVYRLMTLEYSEWSGGFVDGNGNDVHPHKVESEETDLHNNRFNNVMDGEANDSRNYR